MQPTGILSYIGISVTGLLAGAAVGCISGITLGWLLALGYHKQGPSDPGDAPVYVAIGLTMLGGCLGAIVGLVVGIIFSVRMARRKALDQST
jgi:hypothetical protein